MPKGRSRGYDDRIVYSQHVEKDGKDLFKEICVRDLEGIVAKRRLWIYKDDGTSWNYSQAEGSHELLTGKRELTNGKDLNS